MKETGIDIIAKERAEQIHKHKFSLKRDAKFYKKGELLQAALFCLELVNKGKTKEHHWPDHWDLSFAEKIKKKSKIGKLKVAGAFYMAENERLKSDNWNLEISGIAKLIDNELQHDPNSPLN